MALHVSADGAEFFDLIATYLTKSERDRVREAFERARQEHGRQRRRSGEPYVTHPLTVAHYLAEYRLDSPALIAALLHDVAEDTRLSISEIEAEFGREVARLVDGVTKLKEVSAGIAREHQLRPDEIRDASLHKLFGAMIADVRVVLIKLFDRRHNMLTIDALPPAKQQQKALETLAVYAPLANRLGIWRLKTELEALSLKVLNYDAYCTIKLGLERQALKSQPHYDRIARQIHDHLQAADVAPVSVEPCPESIYSLYRHLTAADLPYDQVEGILRVVVMVEDEPACFLALGRLHRLWRPMPNTFDDYINRPLENMYQALHTTVIYNDGQPLKVRIRTVAMNELSEIGVLARWVYAGTPMWTDEIAAQVDRLFATVGESINLEPHNLSLGVQGVVDDIFREQVMVFTPRGDVRELPVGATPLDFAYHIHTAVGDQSLLAYVNEKPYPLNRPLHDGDRVRIVKSGWARPQRTWLEDDLGFLTTTRARTHVRRWFRRLSDQEATEEGHRLLDEELDQLGLPEWPHAFIAEQFGFDHEDALYHALGRAELLPTAVATRVVAQNWHLDALRTIGQPIQTQTGQEFVITHGSGRRLRLCRACNARPGDSIVGVLRTDGTVTVHRENCYALRPDPLASRTIKLGWGRDGSQEVRIITVEIDVYDRSGLLFEIAELMQEENVNISSVNTMPADDSWKVRLHLDLEINSPRQLVRILHRAHALVNVFSARCLPENWQPAAAG